MFSLFLLIALVLQLISGGFALQCYECDINRNAGEDCRAAKNQQTLKCLAGNDDACVYEAQSINGKIDGSIIRRYCARLINKGSADTLTGAWRECRSQRDGNKVTYKCTCNTDNCNSDIHLNFTDGASKIVVGSSGLLILIMAQLFL